MLMGLFYVWEDLFGINERKCFKFFKFEMPSFINKSK